MTTQNPGAPAQQARQNKRTRIDTTANTVVEIDNSTAVAPKKTPSEAALAEVKAAVALRPDATQEVALDVLKTHLKLKTKLQDMTNATERMSDDAFLPRSARFDFKLASNPDVMETEEFKNLDTAMKADTEAFSKLCKTRIMEVQELVLKGTKEDLRKHFYLGLKRIAIMLLNEHATYTDDKPCPYALFVCWMTTESDRISNMTFYSNSTTKDQCGLAFAAGIDGFTEGTELSLLVVKPEDLVIFIKIRDEAKKIIQAVFLTAWNTIENKKTENVTNLRLKKAAIDMLVKEKTEATVMEIDAEASADPQVLRDLITEGIKRATAGLTKEINKLQQTVQRSNPAKNSNRGASSSQQSASSKKKTGTGPREGEKAEKGKEKGKKGKKQPAADTRPPSPRKKRGTSPGRSEPASPSAKKKKQPGGQRQQPRKGNKNPPRARSS
jgi:hypothetical protein